MLNVQKALELGLRQLQLAPALVVPDLEPVPVHALDMEMPGLAPVREPESGALDHRLRARDPAPALCLVGVAVALAPLLVEVGPTSNIFMTRAFAPARKKL